MVNRIRSIIVVSIIIIAGVVTITAVTTYYSLNNTSSSIEQVSTHRLKIITTFYPLYEFTKAVVKDNADVELFIPKGVEPHDWEPTIKDIERLKGFNILIYNHASFEPYIDSLKSNEDVSKGLTMVEVSNNLIKGNDPHVWLDPLLAKEQVINIMNAIISIDKVNEQYYRSNAESYIKRLEELDKEFKEGLRDCNVRKFITLHAAYAYLAERYNLEMITVSGIEPEHDVSPSKIREVIDTAKSYGIDVVYAEEGLDDRLINALANEIGARVLKLSPIEVADDEGNGYIERMRYNLASLREGLGCR
jgi:zinc transport system substrate-binding protein